MEVRPAHDAAWLGTSPRFGCDDAPIAVHLEPGNRTAYHVPDAPALFLDVGPSDEVTVRLPPRFWHGPRTIRSRDDRAVRITIEAVRFVKPVRSYGDLPVLYVDGAADGQAWTLVWRERWVELKRIEVRGDLAALAQAVEKEWMQTGQHRTVTDPGSDVAAVVVDDSTRLDQLRPVFDAIAQVQRDYATSELCRDFAGTDPSSDAQAVRLSAFTLAVVHRSDLEPPLPRPPPPAFDYEGPEPLVDLVPGSPKEPELPARWREQLAGARAGLALCYQYGLRRNPTLSGQLDRVLTVTAKGEVTSTPPAHSRGLDWWVDDCIANALRTVRLQPDGKHHDFVRIRWKLAPGEQVKRRAGDEP